jgi:hypothetical protein
MATFYLNHESELYHHGILGMHWGIRRFQPYPKGHKGRKEIGEATKKKYSMAEAREARDEVLGGKTSASILQDKYGKRGSVRIARRVMNGDDIKTALRKEKTRRIITNVIGAAGSIALGHFVISPILQATARLIVQQAAPTLVPKGITMLYEAMGIPQIGTAAVSNKVLNAVFQSTAKLTPKAKKGAAILNSIYKRLPGNVRLNI